MMNQKKINILIAAFTFFVILPSWAQIETEQVEVVKAFEVQLEDAIKVPVSPKIVVVEPQKKVYQYDVTIVPLEIKYPDPIIKPLAMNVEDPFESKQLFLKAGYGNARNPYFRMRFATAGNDKYELNAQFDYAGVDNTKKIELQKMSSSQGQIGIKYRLKENMFVKGGINYLIDRRNFYFIYADQSMAVDEELLKRNTNSYGAFIGIQNVEKTGSNIDYDLNFKTDFFNTTNFNANEQIIGVDGKFSYQVNENVSIQMPISSYGYRNRISETKESKYYFVLDFNPYFHFHKGAINIKAGAELLVDGGSFRPFPTVDLSYALAEKQFQIFLGVDQRQQINDLRNLITFSPWVNTILDTINVNVGQEYFGGIRGDINFLSYQARAGFRKNINQPLFTNYRVRSLESNDKPSVDYTEMNTVFINGSADFALNDRITIGGILTKNFYGEIAKDAYGLLSIEGDVYAKLDVIRDRITLKGDLYMADRTSSVYPDVSGRPIQVHTTNLFDLNFGLEGWVTEKVGLYFDAYNVLNNKNVRWYGYPQIGIHFNGGVVAKF
ncbi:MAG: hypothetical protein WAT92_15495 [Saprospiraceae bacterium]